MKIKIIITVFSIIMGAGSSKLFAQTETEKLTATILHLDSAFWNGYNHCDTAECRKYIAGDVEFYHDKGGLTDYKHTVDFMKTVASENNQLKRELVKGSLEVYPIPGYGAMEIGAHRFCHMENGKQDCGTFKFVHIWRKTDGAWKITRVVSYGH